MALPLVVKMEQLEFGKVLFPLFPFYFLPIPPSIFRYYLSSLPLPPLPLSSDSVCIQVISLPCISVWSVTTSSDGDIVVGSRLIKLVNQLLLTHC